MYQSVMAWCNEICVESAVKPQPTNQSKSVVFMSTRSSLCNPTHSLIYEQQIWGLPYVQCTKNCPTCENYIANYKIFLEHKLNSRRFPGATSNSRFPGVVDSLVYACEWNEATYHYNFFTVCWGHHFRSLATSFLIPSSSSSKIQAECKSSRFL